MAIDSKAVLGLVLLLVGPTRVLVGQTEVATKE